MPLPEENHKFKPRKKGSQKACDVCGGRYGDPIHQPKSKPKGK